MSSQARIRAPYRMVNMIILTQSLEATRYQEITTHPKPIHAMSANSVFVAVTPMDSMRGSVPAVTNAAISPRNELRVPTVSMVA